MKMHCLISWDLSTARAKGAIEYATWLLTFLPIFQSNNLTLKLLLNASVP